MSSKSRSRHVVALAALIGAALGLAFAGCPSPHLHEGGGGGDTVGGIGGQGLTGLGGNSGTGGTTTGVGGAGNPGAGGRGAGGAGSSTDGGLAGASGVGGGTGVGGAGVGGGVGGAGTGGMGTGGRGTGGSGGVYPTPSVPGQVVITEIMADSAGPPDESGEWFELYNPTNQTFDLQGCLLSDSSPARGNQNVVQTHVIVAPGAYVTMARFGDVSGGFSPTYNYHTTTLPDGGVLDMDADVKFSNNGDRVGITCGVIPIDVVDFTNWVMPLPKTSASGVPKGRTYSLDPTRLNAMDNDAPENWCTGGPAVYPVPAGPDRGTPGTANPPCTCALLACLPWM